MGNSEMIGHDPLAWIKDGAVENSAEVSRSSEQAQERVEPEQPIVEERTVEPREPIVQQQQAAVAEKVAAQPATVKTPEPETGGDGSTTFELGEQLVISTASTVRAEWMDQIVAGVESPVRLNGGSVQTIDTAGLQLLVALIRELGEVGVSWQWGECSELLKSSAEQLGMSDMLSCV